MDLQQLRIAEDLAGVFEGELRFDPVTRSLYATDASLYAVRPLGVAYPRSRDDVVALAKYSSEHHLPLIARGAGTSITGSVLGAGLIVDFSRFMNQILAIGENSVRVQPGVVRDHLNRRLREQGRYFPPDPSNSPVTTIGGMLGVDGAGSHAVRVGSTRDHVRSLEIVLPGGHCLEVGQEPLVRGASGDTGAGLPAVRRNIISRVSGLLAEHADLIRERQPPLIRNCSGYHLRGVLSQEHLHLPRLLVGSEGTLCLFTEAELHTSPLPAHRGVALLLFGQMETAIRAVQGIADQQPSACDLLDRRLLSLAREADERFEVLIPKTAEAALIVEQTGFTERQVRERLQTVIDSARETDSAVHVAQQAFDFEQVEFLWSLPYRVVPLLTGLRGNTRPLPLIEDAAVPPAALRDFLVQVQRVFQKHQVTASLYAHAASGQVHLRPFLAPPRTEDAGRIESLARDVYEVVFAVGGTISGEHGDGLSRTSFIRSQYGPLYRVFQQIKDVFDPHNLLNPGKIVSDDPHATVRNFRPVPNGEMPTVALQLQWNAAEFGETAARCNGCGVCRTSSAPLRMCPFFHLDPVEEASPRSKANVVRELMTGSLDPRELASDSTKRLLDQCFNCKQCHLECPTHVDIPQLVNEIRAEYVAANGLSRADWILSRAHSFGKLGCATAPFSNWLLNNRGSRWLIERLLGIARNRKLPPFSRSTLMRSAPQSLTAKPDSKGPVRPVIYFVDHYANYHDPELGRAFLQILKHNDIPVHVPPGQTASGLAMISAGDLEAARELAGRNVRELAEFAREGHSIVCTEPAAALCLQQEYPLLLDHPDVQVVADRVVEAGAFLAALHGLGKLRTDFAPLDVVAAYHTPCHLKSLNRGTPLADLLSLIPGFRLHRIEEGCSGMAGAFGLTRENFETSLLIGDRLIRRMGGGEFRIGCTECSSCKLQMEQGTAVPTLHPLKLLALAYGLMPELQNRLKPGNKRLMVT